MIPKSSDLNIGEWKDVSKPYHKKNKQHYFELRLKDINKCVGKASLSKYGGSVIALFSTESDGIHRCIPANTNLDDINKHWVEMMDKLLAKMFK
jgi:hypothetical protein